MNLFKILGVLQVLLFTEQVLQILLKHLYVCLDMPSASVYANLYCPCIQSWHSKMLSLLFRTCWTTWAENNRWESQWFSICSDYSIEFCLKIKKSLHLREIFSSLENDCLCSPFISEKALETNIQLHFKGKKKGKIKEVSFNAWSPCRFQCKLLKKKNTACKSEVLIIRPYCIYH